MTNSIYVVTLFQNNEPSLSELLLKYDSKNVVMEKTYFKNK